MATYTPNLNLYKPDSTDNFENFRAEFNNNMEKIDQSGGGGGGGGSAKVIKNQTLTFVNLVATITDSDITADSDFIIYYYDEAEAESANITAVASAGTITFTAETAPINPIVCDVVLLDVSGGGGGSGTVNYSTTEQVIGTWIDGKPLYQITVDVANPANDSSEHLVDLTALSIEECPFLFGYAVRHSGANDITYYANSIETDGWYYFKARYDNFRDSIMYTCLFRNDSISRMRFTIQYTKVTD